MIKGGIEMRLFKNVDIEDLNKILKEGILPVSKTQNNNWNKGRRANNSKDVVYLFKAKENGDSFTQYGLVLLEVEVEDATSNEMLEQDVNRGLYEEYVAPMVAAEKIVNVYIPKIFKRRIEDIYEVALPNNVNYVEVEFDCHTSNKAVTKENVQDIFAKTAPLSTNDFNYLRGLANNRMVDCEYKWKYKI